MNRRHRTRHTSGTVRVRTPSSPAHRPGRRRAGPGCADTPTTAPPSPARRSGCRRGGTFSGSVAHGCVPLGNSTVVLRAGGLTAVARIGTRAYRSIEVRHCRDEHVNNDHAQDLVKCHGDGGNRDDEGNDCGPVSVPWPATATNPQRQGYAGRNRGRRTIDQGVSVLVEVERGTQSIHDQCRAQREASDGQGGARRPVGPMR